jgi:hypothetical protein
MRDERGLLEAFLADGRLPLSITGFILLLSGWFAIFQSLTGYFLPQDVHALGFDARQLAAMANIRVVHFMFHYRVAFGGTLLGVGCSYWFLAEFPLRARESWAWWTFLVSGICGFASFSRYLGYRYLDTWHGIATLSWCRYSRQTVAGAPGSSPDAGPALVPSARSALSGFDF